MVTVKSDDPARGNGLADNQFALERYRYILQQIHSVNDNVYRFVAIYQTLSVALVGGGFALFVGYRRWHIPATVARSGFVGVISLVTVVAAFVVLLIAVGILDWVDYRREECDLTDVTIHPGFRKRPEWRNSFRWYETYIILFIVASNVFLWVFSLAYILPSMR